MQTICMGYSISAVQVLYTVTRTHAWKVESYKRMICCNIIDRSYSKTEVKLQLLCFSFSQVDMFQSANLYGFSLVVCWQILLVGANYSATMLSGPAKKAEAIDSLPSLETLGYSQPTAGRQVHEEALHWTSNNFRFHAASDSQLPRQRYASNGRNRRSVGAAENGEGVDIYLFDTGIAYEMEEFEGRAKFVGRDFVNPGGEGRDDHGHGTYTASLAAGKTVGKAKKATIYSVKVLNKYKHGNSAAIMQGLAYVEELCLSNRTRRAIVLLPMVSPYHRQTNELVERLVSNGITVVTSAGNNADDACKYTPGSARGVINTGAVDERDAIWQYSVRWSLAFYYMKGSNYGNCVDLFAPGTNIYGSSMNPALAYVKLSGTSATAPQTAGVAAMILQAFPTATPEEVKERIIAYSKKNLLDLQKVPTSLRSLTPNRLLATPKHIHEPTGEDEETDKSDSVTTSYAPVNTPTTVTLPNPTSVSAVTKEYKPVHSVSDMQEGTSTDTTTTTEFTTTTTCGESSTLVVALASNTVWPATSRVLTDHIEQSSTVKTVGAKSPTQTKLTTRETSFNHESASSKTAIHIGSTSSSGNPTQPESTTLETSAENTHTATGIDRTTDSMTPSSEVPGTKQLEEKKVRNLPSPTGKQNRSQSRESSSLDSISVLPLLYQQQVAQGQTKIAVPSVCAIQAAYEEMKRKEYTITYIHPIIKRNGTCFSVIFDKVEPRALTTYRAHFHLHYHELEKLLTSRQVIISNVTAILGYMDEDGSRRYLLISESNKEQDLVLRGFLYSDYIKMTTIVRQQGYWMITILLTSDKVSRDAIQQASTATAVYRSFRSRKHVLYFRNIRAELIKQHIKFMWKKGYHITYISTYTLPHQGNSLFLVGFAICDDARQHFSATIKQKGHLNGTKMQPYINKGLHLQTLTPFTNGSSRKLAYLLTFSRDR